MQKYIVLDDKGYPIYPIYFEGEDIIPKGAIEIDDDTERHYLSGEYKVNGEWVKISTKPTDEQLLATAKSNAETTIKNKLSDTDYKCLKYVDGELSEEEYSKTKNERSKLRELYNSIGVATTIEKVETILEEVSHAGGSD